MIIISARERTCKKKDCVFHSSSSNQVDRNFIKRQPLFYGYGVWGIGVGVGLGSVPTGVGV